MLNRYPNEPDFFSGKIDVRPATKFISLEPYEAACAFKSGVEGKFATVGGDMPTMMAGLACGVPSTLAYPVLRDHFTAYAKISEECSSNGMRLLKEVKGGGIESGECGGSGWGFLHHLSQGSDKAKEFCEKIGLTKDSMVLIINTEAATDPINYNKCLGEPMAEASFDYHMNTQKVADSPEDNDPT
jgi:diaminopropionate ammonia-lyase